MSVDGLTRRDATFDSSSMSHPPAAIFFLSSLLGCSRTHFQTINFKQLNKKKDEQERFLKENERKKEICRRRRRNKILKGFSSFVTIGAKTCFENSGLLRLQSKVQEKGIPKNYTGLLTLGAGATFDLTFFDNSKVIDFNVFLVEVRINRS